MQEPFLVLIHKLITLAVNQANVEFNIKKEIQKGREVQKRKPEKGKKKRQRKKNIKNEK